MASCEAGGGARGPTNVTPYGEVAISLGSETSSSSVILEVCDIEDVRAIESLFLLFSLGHENLM